MASETTTSRRWWQRKVEDRALVVEAPPVSMLAPVMGGQALTDHGALQIADCWACVVALTHAALLCPLTCFRVTDEGRQPVLGGRGPQILRQPAPGIPQSQFTARLMQSLVCHGEAFIGKLRDAGQLVQLEVLNPAQVSVWIGLDGEPAYTYVGPNRILIENLGRQDIIHIKGLTDQLGLRGLSPIAQCREALNLAHNLAVSSSSTWANGAVPAGVVSVPPGPQAEEHAAALSDAWAARHQGPTARGRIAVVNSDIKFQQVSLPLSDQEFIATRKLSTAEIARIFRVPVSVIGGSAGDSLTYKTTESEGQQFVTYGLQPWLTLVEDALSLDSELIPGQNARCAFSFDNLLRSDAATRAAVAVQLTAAGIMSRQEARSLNGLTGPPPPMPADTQEAQAFATGLARSGLVTGEANG